MTREELFAKREQKLKEKRMRRLMVIGGIIAALLLVFLIVRIATGRVSKKPGADSSVKTTEQTGASSGTTVSRTTESQSATGTQGSAETAGTAQGVTETPAAPTTDETASADDTAVKGTTDYTAEGVTGWNESGSGRWYKTAEGQQYMNGWKMLDGSRYFFKADGFAATGWEMADDGNMYYFNEDGTWDSSQKQKLVALTYDDGPSWNTDLILDVLGQYNAKATFFVVGVNQADYYTSELLREYNEGMEIANHTYEHVILSHSDGDTITAQCNDDCDITDGLTMKISAPADLKADGSPKEATLSTDYNTTAFPDTYTIEYYKGEEKLDGAPSAGGHYTAKVTVGEATASVDFTIVVDPAYTITIPATVNIGGGTAEFKAENVTLPDGAKINITVDGENTESGQTTFNAKNESKDSTVQYTIKNGDATIADGGTALTFTEGGTQTLKFTKTSEPTYAGKHTETLTFGVAVEDAAKYNVHVSASYSVDSMFEGEPDQIGLTGAMEPVTVRIPDDYKTIFRFNKFDDIVQNGITKHWVDDYTVTVSGTPTADTNVFVRLDMID